jgi:hypothetical protein
VKFLESFLSLLYWFLTRLANVPNAASANPSVPQTGNHHNEVYVKQGLHVMILDLHCVVTVGDLGLPFGTPNLFSLPCSYNILETSIAGINPE